MDLALATMQRVALNVEDVIVESVPGKHRLVVSGYSIDGAPEPIVLAFCRSVVEGHQYGSRIMVPEPKLEVAVINATGGRQPILLIYLDSSMIGLFHEGVPRCPFGASSIHFFFFY